MKCWRCGKILRDKEEKNMAICFSCDSTIGHFGIKKSKEEKFNFKVGDIANGVETSEEILQANSYVEALEQVIEESNLYCEPY